MKSSKTALGALVLALSAVGVASAAQTQRATRNKAGKGGASGSTGKAGKEQTDDAGKQGKADKNSCAGATKKALAANNLTSGGGPPYYTCQQARDDSRGQTGGNVTVGAMGSLSWPYTPYNRTLSSINGMCPVNVHWHLGAEHFSAGEFDITPSSPTKDLPMTGTTVGRGLQCDTTSLSPSQKAEYNWKHCIDMEVGETYEFHWPHSILGACGTDDQYQDPFQEGVFCNAGDMVLPADLSKAVGVQTQVFVIVNDEEHTYTGLINGMIVDPSNDMGQKMTVYTGSTTGDKFGNDVTSTKPCDDISGITWQVDRMCHLLSASTMDELCKTIKTKPHMKGVKAISPGGSRVVVVKELVHNNQQYFDSGL